MDLSYYKINKLLWRWSRTEGARIVHDAGLSMDRAPPALPASPAPVAKAVPAPKPPKPDPMVKMVDDIWGAVDAFSRFKTWLNTADPPKPAKAPAPTKLEKTVPAFDIQEIPGAMRKEMMPIGAKLMERWFAGALNYSPTDADEAAEINQDGRPYPPEMYDTTTVKLDWVLRFARAKKKYDYLINEAIRSPAAKETLKGKLGPYKERLTLLDSADICGDDVATLHRRFQFQLASVDGSFGQKIELLLHTLARGGVPDDLSSALGSFNLYAALGHARFYWDAESRRTRADVRGIWVYVKDNYTFTDRKGGRSQYLGHWSRDGVIVIPLDAVAATSPYVPYLESPVSLPYLNTSVTLGNPVIRGNLYHPVHNSDFRQWAIRHHRGGDFVIYSDRRYVPVVPPIEIYL
ncbi:DUF6402 family protein [Burkholderia sp. NRF60-BP8]|uniref:DUF6402 family protein n=1 Tax=Burkholderia sp. NRF60-BP8 TaxID=1637853 RepID=UPI0007540433|nr:DUF6402 family protein [Burkholderia sp. NRF60-BP8]AOI79774.1 hypothetical protein WS54_26555 [Burkholderia sp. NRF60-BP8]KVA11992.1 hypothetical protein WS54_15875 [Burkholderia sp. NRF60-BP8]